MSDETKGLFGKYLVYPAEAWGQEREYRAIEDCFVLRPGQDEAAKKALAAYANATENVELSRDLWRWLARLS